MKSVKMCVSLILLGLSPFAFSYVQVVDQASINQDQYANYKRMAEAIKEFVVENAKLIAQGVAAENEVESINNGFANVIARLDRGKEERQNLEQLERAQPAKDACDTLSLSAGLGDASCDEIDQLQQLSMDRAKRYSTATGGGIMNTSRVTDVQDVNAENNRAAIAIIDKCQALDGKCRNSELWITDKPLTVDEYKALQLQHDLAANINISVPNVAGLKPGSSEYARAVLEDVRRENTREEARASLEVIQIAQHGTITKDGQRAPGRVEQYTKFQDARFGEKQWICEITNSCNNTIEVYAPPAELQRRAIQLQAVMASLKLDQYKSDLRKEMLLKNMMLYELNRKTPQ